MKIFVDANLLVYLNAVKTPSIRRIYEDFYLNLLSKYKAYTDVLVLDEVIYISRKKYRVPYDVTADFIDTIVLPFIEILTLGEPEYKKSVEIIQKYRVKPSDALHTATMLLHNITRIASEDREYDKIKEITRLWL